MDGEGDLVLLADQNRVLWDRAEIEEGTAFARAALARPPFGPYALQAGIAAVHATAKDAAATDWSEIVGFYDLLFAADPTPVIPSTAQSPSPCAMGRNPASS